MVLKFCLKNSPEHPALCNWIFEIFILAYEPSAKALPSLETCILVTNNLCGKIFLL